MNKDYKLMIYGNLSTRSFGIDLANRLYKYYVDLFGIENVKFIYLGN